MYYRLIKESLIGVAIIVGCKSLCAKDSLSKVAVFHNVSYLQGSGIYLTPSNSLVAQSANTKKSRGLSYGIRVSKNVFTPKLSLVGRIQLNYLWHHERFSKRISDTNYLYNDIDINQLLLQTGLGIRYNFKNFRTAFSISYLQNIFSNSTGLNEIGRQSQLFNNNRFVPNYLDLAASFDVYIPFTNNVGLVLFTSLPIGATWEIPPRKYTTAEYSGIGLDFKFK